MQRVRASDDIPAAFVALQRRPLRTEAADILRTALLSGQLREGDRLNESRISVQLGISRGPLREALRQLEQEGRVVSRPGYGTYVRNFTVDDILEGVSVRELVEPLAIDRSMSGMREPLLVGLRVELAHMRTAAAAGDAKALASYHVAFHEQFYIFARHRLLLQVWERTRVPIGSYVRMQEAGFSRLSDVPTAHDHLVELVATGDTTAVKSEMAAHLRKNVARMEAAFGSTSVSVPMLPRARSRASKRNSKKR